MSQATFRFSPANLGSFGSKRIRTSLHYSAVGAHPNWLRRVLLLLLAIGMVGALAPDVFGVVVQLDNGNSRAIFNTQASDVGTLGLNTWEVDTTDHMQQQWFWYRVGSGTQERPIGETGAALAHVSSTALDLDGDTINDFLLASYIDNETTITPERFRVQLRYGLTGGTIGSKHSDLVEVIRVENLDTNNPLEFHLHQYVNFDLNNSPSDDSVVITGLPNTARQTDPLMQIAETVVTPPPSRWEVNTYSNTLASLNDAAITTLSNTVGPIIGADATWSFQWDYAGASEIKKGGVVLISKDKNIRPGDHVVPEPSSLALAGLGLVGLLAACARRRRTA